MSDAYIRATTADAGVQVLTCDTGDVALSGGYTSAGGAISSSVPFPPTDTATPTGWQWTFPAAGNDIYVVCANVTP
ncbi:hypothetical protein ACFFWC_10665 [Plantactinospora siamensis]|uniref:Uncharacterized protein n=1 Tax=Plantactinospora siamensis TaxID=555372 RepID=A0ABV6P0E5_9ACTN